MQSSIEYLGYTLTANGIKPNQDKLTAIEKVPAPRNNLELQAYLGLLNYYHRFLPNLSSELHPLYMLLRKGVKYLWTAECQSAFESSKKLLLSNIILEPYHSKKPLILAVDASPYGVGAVLSHRVDGVEKPIAFASATLTVAQQNYAQVHKEALAVMFGVDKFHKYIFGYHFKLVTDNSAVKEIFNPCRGTSSIAMARLQRWALKLTNYDYEIEHRPGKMMGHVDAMSRLPLASEQTKIECATLGINSVQDKYISQSLNQDIVREEQQKDTILKKVLNNVLNGWATNIEEELKYYKKNNEHFGIDHGILYFDDRVVIPKAMKNRILELLHVNHQGMVKMKMNARRMVWWRNMDKDITELVNTCTVCQARQTVQREVVTTTWKEATDPFERIHLDLCYYDNRTLLVIVDAYTKYIEVKIVNMSRAVDIIEQLENFFACFGLPKEVVTDNGPPFNAELFTRFLKVRGIIASKSPPYHPQSNGLAERAVRTVKDVLKKFTLDEKVQPLSLIRKINRFLLQYRNEPCTVTKVTPSALIFSYTPNTQLQRINPIKTREDELLKHTANMSYKQRADELSAGPLDKKGKETSTANIEFKEGEKVWYRNHFKELIRWIPVTVIKKISSLRYVINLGGCVRVVHVNQIRKGKAISVEPAGIYERQDTQSAQNNVRRTRKRPRSETTPPPIRRSDRLKGQPPFKYPR